MDGSDQRVDQNPNLFDPDHSAFLLSPISLPPSSFFHSSTPSISDTAAHTLPPLAAVVAVDMGFVFRFQNTLGFGFLISKHIFDEDFVSKFRFLGFVSKNCFDEDFVSRFLGFDGGCDF
ncbi:hypothetical protein Droror1_Dr00010659 [Drosera rotundifolia]